MIKATNLGRVKLIAAQSKNVKPFPQISGVLAPKLEVVPNVVLKTGMLELTVPFRYNSEITQVCLAHTERGLIIQITTKSVYSQAAEVVDSSSLSVLGLNSKTSSTTAQ